MATNLRRHSWTAEFTGAIAWGLLVLGLTLVILLLGAIVLPAQANEIPAERPNTVTYAGATVQMYES